MSITIERKQELIKEFATHKDDTGSTEIQIAVLTERINNLSEHMKINKKDFHSRRGLLKLVSRRRHLLSYLKDRSLSGYETIIKRLGLRK